jgi:hypothetical protein
LLGERTHLMLTTGCSSDCLTLRPPASIALSVARRLARPR